MRYTYRYSKEPTERTTGLCPVCYARSVLPKRQDSQEIRIPEGTCLEHRYEADSLWVPIYEAETGWLIDEQARMDQLLHPSRRRR